MFLLVLVLVLLFGFYVWNKLSLRRQRDREIQSLRSACTALQTSCSTIITSLGDEHRAIGLARINVVADLLGDAATAELRSNYEVLWNNLSTQRRDFAQILSHVDTLGEDDLVGWTQAEGELRQLNSELKESQQEIESWQTTIDTRISEIEAVKARPNEMEARITTCAARITAVAAQGFKVEKFEADIEAALNKLQSTLAAVESKDFATVTQECDAIVSLLNAATNGAEALPVIRERLETARLAHGVNLENLSESFNAAKAADAVLAEHHSDDSWAHVAGNGTEAEDRYEWAKDQLIDVEQLISSQEFDEAAEVLQGIEEALADVNGLLSAIIDQKNRAELAKGDVGSLINEARGSLAAAHSFITSNIDDIEEQPLLQQLVAAEGELVTIERDATGNKLDYIAICGRVRRVMQDIESVHGDAKRQDDEMEQLRRRRDRERAEGVASITQLKRYVSHHRGDVGTHVQPAVLQAERYLGDGDHSGDHLQHAILNYQRAEQEADQALQEAQNLVRRAERAREEQRQREAALFAAVAYEAGRLSTHQGEEQRRARARSYSSTTSWGTTGYSSPKSSSSNGGFKSSSSRSGFSGGGGGFKSSSPRSGSGGGFKSGSSKSGW
jgi:peptidoglycan hydrolase CwlO-like protein